MPWAIVGVGVIALLALIASQSRTAHASTPSRPAWMDILTRLHEASLEELHMAYRSAMSAGYYETAEEVQRELDLRYGLGKILTPYTEEDEEGTAYDKQPGLEALDSVTSPLENISDDAWRQFENVMRTGRLDMISPGWSLGLYYASARRLADLGYMTNVRKEKFDTEYGDREVYRGDFVEPYTLDGFLSDPLTQYGMFAHDMQDLRPMVEHLYGSYIGKQAEGQTITLSGLLALAKMAGMSGMGSWLVNDEDHKKFQNTTAMFKKATGIF